MNYPNRAKETDRTNVELGLGRRATKAVFVSLLSLFFVFPIPQNAAAQSAGFAFLEFTLLEQTEAAPGQYAILASHPPEIRLCTKHWPSNVRRLFGRDDSPAKKACTDSLSGGFVSALCEGNFRLPQQIKNAWDAADIFMESCQLDGVPYCSNFCPHAAGTAGPIPTPRP